MKNIVMETDLMVSKLVLKILIRTFDNQTWSQQSIDAVHENQRNILTRKYSEL